MCGLVGDLFGFVVYYFVVCDFGVWVQVQLGCEVFVVGEVVYVGVGFVDDYQGCCDIDVVDVCQVYVVYLEELFVQVEFGCIVGLVVFFVFGWIVVVDVQLLKLCIDFCVVLCELCEVEVEVCQCLFECEQVFVVLGVLQIGGDFGFVGVDVYVFYCGEFVFVVFVFDDCLQDFLFGFVDDVGDGVGQLDVYLCECFLYVLNVVCLVVQDCGVLVGQCVQYVDFVVWVEGVVQQFEVYQLLQLLVVQYVVFVVGDIFDVVCVDQQYGEVVLFQQFEYWDLVYVGGFYCYDVYLVGVQLVGQVFQIGGEVVEFVYGFVIVIGWDGVVVGGVVDVDVGGVGVGEGEVVVIVVVLGDRWIVLCYVVFYDGSWDVVLVWVCCFDYFFKWDIVRWVCNLVGDLLMLMMQFMIMLIDGYYVLLLFWFFLMLCFIVLQGWVLCQC